MKTASEDFPEVFVSIPKSALSKVFNPKDLRLPKWVVIDFVERYSETPTVSILVNNTEDIEKAKKNANATIFTLECLNDIFAEELEVEYILIWPAPNGVGPVHEVRLAVAAA